MLYFNSHPHEEDDILYLVVVARMKYFNSHPHEEDDDNKQLTDAEYEISTHILTKRMTEMVEHGVEEVYISTHILTKRMTSPVMFCSANRNISTHILTKRMTLLHQFCLYLRIHFNSHPHEEDDCMSESLKPQYFKFQLTSSRRG